MKKSIRMCLLSGVLCFGAISVTGAEISLFDWAIISDGALFSPSAPPPGSINTAGFDFATGFGTVVATVNGAGPHYLGFFVDHEIDESVNTFFNEFGASGNAPKSGQSWEIDEPGFSYGDIYANLSAGALDNANGVPSSAPDDVSMALAWSFFLGADESASVIMNVGPVPPPAGFYLVQTDPDSDLNLYFSSSLRVSGGQTVPEAASTCGMLAIALGALRIIRRRAR